METTKDQKGKEMITVRDAAPADASAIYAQCWARGWHYAYGQILPTELITRVVGPENVAARVASYPEWLAASVTRGEINLVAVSNGRVIGQCTGGVSRTPDVADWEMYGLYVNPDYIGCGAGRALFDAFVRRITARGASTFFCECFSENKSMEFYRHMGGRVLREYDPGDKYAHHKVSVVVFDTNS